MHRPLAFIVAIALLAPAADAQVLPVPRRSSAPVMWGSLSAGMFQVNNDIVDGRTQSVWRFGTALQYRGSVEMDVGNYGAVGLVAGLADAPLRYGTAVPTTACPGVCDAHAKIWTLMAGFHMGGGVGFHQIIDLSAGTTIYRDFTADDGGALPPESPDKDVALSVGYGFGWGFGPRMQLMLVQDAAYVLHQREGVSGNQNSSSQHYVTRVGLRVGLGTKAR